VSEGFFNLSKYLGALLLTGCLTIAFALAPQIDLSLSRGSDYNGVYALIDHDEAFYAAYIQSLVEGKPFRNSPFSGAVDGVGTRQTDSYLSIQFLSTYPTSLVAKLFGLPISATMIALIFVCGLFSVWAIFHLFFIFTEDVFESLVGTIAVIFLGAVAGGQGGLIGYFLQGNVQYSTPMLFLRRASPAVSFPVLFLFFISVWKSLFAELFLRKIVYTFLATASFAYLVFSYFYHWTTALGWLCGLLLLLLIFRREVLRANWITLFLMSAGMLTALIPYAILVSNRSLFTDSVLLLELTRAPDLFRIPEVLSFAAIGLLGAGRLKGIVDFHDSKIILVASLALIAPIVFNQQVITGRSLQSFHYELFCANYVAVGALFMARSVLVKKWIGIAAWRRTLGWATVWILLFASVDSYLGLSTVRGINITRDELVPIAQRIKELNASSRSSASGCPGALLSFDFAITSYVNSNDFPSLSSQPVLWSPHLKMFPDISSSEDRKRLFAALYYQGFVGSQLKAELLEKADSLVPFAIFGPKRISSLYTGEVKRITQQEIEQIISDFELFSRRFDYEMARSPLLSFVLVNEDTENLDLSVVDRWYERDAGEGFGKFRLYRVSIRAQN
jgi:hypothetical protein